MKLAELRFLTDENVSPSVVEFLRQSGYDIVDVKEEGWHGTDDASLLARAWKSKRFVISHDRDFGRVAIAQRHPCYGVLYLRLKNQCFRRLAI